ncbi:MAG: hypothetical protein V8R64_02265 [Thomasclavelia sp.]
MINCTYKRRRCDLSIDVEIMDTYIDEFTGLTFQSRKFIRQINNL